MSDDKAVWESICRRDARVFDAFYQECAPRLRAFLRQILGSPQAADDIVQDTFVALWKRPNGFQPGRGSLRAYLYGIARNRAAEWWRGQRPLDIAVDQPSKPCQSQIISVHDAFAQLPEDQRTLLWLREVEGQSYAELATILEIPVGTVRSRLFAARENLRSIWHGAPRRAKEDA